MKTVPKRPVPFGIPRLPLAAFSPGGFLKNVIRLCPVFLYGLLSLGAPVPAQSGILDAAVAPDAPVVLDGTALFRLGKDRNLCALTFDDGPGSHTERLLDILQQQGVSATFFVVGSRVKTRSRSVLRMAAEGHEVANHTLNHRTLRRLPEAKQREEITVVQQMLLDLGMRSCFLRPPFGRYDAVTERIARELQLRIVMWSVDSNDWKQIPDVTCLKSVGGGSGLRGVFLFHDTLASTVEAMPQIIDALETQGCRFVTLSEYIQAVENMQDFTSLHIRADAVRPLTHPSKIIIDLLSILSTSLFRFPAP